MLVAAAWRLLTGHPWITSLLRSRRKTTACAAWSSSWCSAKPLAANDFMKHVVLLCLLGVSIVRAEVFIAQGSMAGEVTSTGVLLQTRLTAIPGPELDQGGDIQ